MKEPPPTVSIIMPLFNSEAYLSEALESIRRQSYDDWELIVVDDGSTDRSFTIAESFPDDRIRLFQHHANRGVGAARNTALEHVRGRFVAFMDSDDVWLNEKLERQLAYMNEQKACMCFTAYETIEADGSHRNFVKVPSRIDYRGFLKNTITCSHTVVFDLDAVSVDWLKAPTHEEYDFPEDLAIWLQVLNHGVLGIGFNEVLAKNRKHNDSRSSRKRKAVRRTWNQYRKGERLGVLYASYCLFWQLTHAVLKRL